MVRALYVLYVLRVPGVSPVLLGVIYAAGSIGFPIGAFFAGPIARRLGTGPTIIWGAGVSNAAYLLIILAHSPLAYAVPVLVAAQLLVSFPSAITAINQSSLRQVWTPNEMRGRVNGASLFLSSGLGTVGGLIAGLLGQAVGLRTTLIIAVIGIQLGTVILLISPFRRFREPPPGPQTVS